MFLKLDYSELKSGLVFQGAESLNDLPKALFLLPIPKASVMSLLSDIREAALSKQSCEFEGCGYHVYISCRQTVSSDNSIFICIDEIKGEMSRPVFHETFDGYYGCSTLLEGTRKFKTLLREAMSEEEIDAAASTDSVKVSKCVMETASDSVVWFDSVPRTWDELVNYVKQCPENIGNIKHQTTELCLEAVKAFALAIQYVRFDNPYTIITLLQVNNAFVAYCNVDKKVVKAACSVYGKHVLQYLKSIDEDLIWELLEEDVENIRYVPEYAITNRIRWYVIDSNEEVAVKYLKDLSIDMVLRLVEEHPEALGRDNYSEEICYEAVVKNIRCCKYLNTFSKRIAEKIMLLSNGELLSIVPEEYQNASLYKGYCDANPKLVSMIKDKNVSKEWLFSFIKDEKLSLDDLPDFTVDEVQSMWEDWLESPEFRKRAKEWHERMMNSLREPLPEVNSSECVHSSHNTCSVDKEVSNDATDMLVERNIKVHHLITENLKFFPDADERVLKFIAHFLYHGVPEIPLEVSCESVRSTFRAGYCYYFALMLRAAFLRGTVCQAYPYGHIVWLDTNGVPYDVEGVYSGEADEFKPVEELGSSLKLFKHID